MKAQMLKMSGCKSEKEFYSKYPSEESFFKSFPQARQMQYGGFNSAPTEEQFFNIHRMANIPYMVFDKGGDVPCASCGKEMKKGGEHWIQNATKNMRTDKPCTGSKFGSSTCPPGSKRYNLAKTFKTMAKKELGGDTFQGQTEDDFLAKNKNTFLSHIQNNVMNNIAEEEANNMSNYMQQGGPYGYMPDMYNQNMYQQAGKSTFNQELGNYFAVKQQADMNANPYMQIKEKQVPVAADGIGNTWDLGNPIIQGKPNLNMKFNQSSGMPYENVDYNEDGSYTYGQYPVRNRYGYLPFNSNPYLQIKYKGMPKDGKGNIDIGDMTKMKVWDNMFGSGFKMKFHKDPVTGKSVPIQVNEKEKNSSSQPNKELTPQMATFFGIPQLKGTYTFPNEEEQNNERRPWFKNWNFGRGDGYEGLESGMMRNGGFLPMAQYGMWNNPYGNNPQLTNQEYNPELYNIDNGQMQEGDEMAGDQQVNTPIDNTVMEGMQSSTIPGSDITIKGKMKKSYSGEDKANMIIAGMNAGASFFEQGDALKNRQKFESRLGSDAQFIPMNTGDRGSYMQTGMDTGQFNPFKQSAPVQFAGQSYGMYGNPNQQYATGGQYNEGAEVDMTQEELDEFIRNGGKVQFI